MVNVKTTLIAISNVKLFKDKKDSNLFKCCFYVLGFYNYQKMVIYHSYWIYSNDPESFFFVLLYSKSKKKRN